MAAWKSGVAILMGSAVMGGLVHRKVSLSMKEKEHNSPTSVIPGQSKWDEEWDFRGPKSVFNPDQYKEAKATRVIIMIRHGQYNLKGQCDSEKYLTELGREQADMVGKRLKEMEPAEGYTTLHQSTMTRAMETCSIIRKHLTHVPVMTDAILCEGGPIRPVPASAHWRPESHVSHVIYVCVCVCVCVCVLARVCPCMCVYVLVL